MTVKGKNNLPKDLKIKNFKFKILCGILSLLLLPSFSFTKILFANGPLIEDVQTVREKQAKHFDNGLFSELMETEDGQIDIAKISLLIAMEETPGLKVDYYLDCIDWYVRMLKVRTSNIKAPEKVISEINDFFFGELGFIYVQTGNLEDLYLNSVIDRRKGNCVGISILYLAIAERMHLPFFGVNVPDHIFIRFDNGEKRTNIETGHEGMSLPNSFYIISSTERFGRTCIENGCYLKNLSKKEVISNIFLNRSKIRRDKGNIREALNDSNKAILLNPKNPGAYSNRGVIYEKMGMARKAIENYGKAISLNPKYASAYYNRGSVFGMEGMLERAIKDFNKAIFLNPQFTLSYFNRAIALKKIGRTGKAIQDYDRVIYIDPNVAQAYCNRGVAFAETGKFDEAISDFNKAIELDPNLSDAYFARGIFFADMKELNKAIDDLGKCIKLSPGKSFAYYLRGKALRETGKPEMAILDFSQAIKIKPSYAGLYIDRGRLFLQLNRLDKAINDFDKSLELFPGNPVAFKYRGESYKKKGQPKKALDDFKSFLEIVPDSQESDLIRNEVQKLE